MVSSTFTPTRRSSPSFQDSFKFRRQSRSPSPKTYGRPSSLIHPATVKPKSVFKRLSPKFSSRPTSAQNSPVKREPLGMTNRNDLNAIIKSPSPPSRLSFMKPRRMSEEEALAELAGERHRSPLKRSDGIMNLHQVSSSGSPVAKRRSTMGLFGSYSPVSPSHRHHQPVFGTPSFPTQTPRRLPSLKKTANTNLHTDKPSFARARPQARNSGGLGEFATPVDPASKIRKMQSVDGFLPQIPRGSPFVAGPLPNASTHTTNLNNSFGFQDAPVQSNPFSRSAGPMSRPNFRASIGGGELSKPNPLSVDNWTTPQNYKFARPNQAAFHSTGFVPKRGRKLSTDMPVAQQPETPCKRPATLQNNRPKAKGYESPISPFKGGNMFGRLQRRDSIASFDDSSSEVDFPPTPTKKVYGSGMGGLFSGLSGLKRNRTDNSDIPSFEPVDKLTFGTIPKTPANRDTVVPPDPSSLSISGKKSTFQLNTTIPTTPVKNYLDFLRPEKTPCKRTPSFGSFTSLEKSPNVPKKNSLLNRFAEAKLVGSGEFSEVYMVTEGVPASQASTPFPTQPSTPSHHLATPTFGRISARPQNQISGRVFAVKKFKKQYHGVRERERYMEEVEILKALGKHEHVIEYIDSWEEGRIIYIQTEFCENGSLDTFLDDLGNKGRLDEFRVWKIMLELCQGLKHIHDSGFIHLDIKPANVLIAFDGSLKISDFGMATKWPAPYGIEREGDRQYISPEALQSHIYDKPGDIFSLGLTMIEIAGNEALPPNGPEWQSLRQGDISVAPVLSTSKSGELVIRDEDGNPISTEIINDHDSAYASSSFSSNFSLDEDNVFGNTEQPASRRPSLEAESSRSSSRVSQQSFSGALLHNPRNGDLIHPPKFMEEGGLERIIGTMIAANPRMRPTASDILSMEELCWVDERRRAAATIFEGLWGPDNEDSIMDDDDSDWRMEM